MSESPVMPEECARVAEAERVIRILATRLSVVSDPELNRQDFELMRDLILDRPRWFIEQLERGLGLK